MEKAIRLQKIRFTFRNINATLKNVTYKQQYACGENYEIQQ